MEANQRLERKFFITSMSADEVEVILKLIPFKFREIYSQRSVNNIYFDTPFLANYFDNIDGNYFKRKTRIRWYGDLLGEINNPRLEVKGKDGVIGTKEVFPLENFNLVPGKDKHDILSVIYKSKIGEKIKVKGLIPTLLNSYQRKYFQSSEKDFRFTIDKNMEYYSLNDSKYNFRNKYQDSNSVILELKYSTQHDDNAEIITNTLPFRMTKSSKYIMGIERAVTNYQL